MLALVKSLSEWHKKVLGQTIEHSGDLGWCQVGLAAPTQQRPAIK
jgi:hypothetical protein